MRRPLVIAHNGCDGFAADGAEGLAHALRSADMAEVDVRASADGVCVLSHDDRGFAARGWAELRSRHGRGGPR